MLALGCIPAALEPRARIQAAGQAEHLRRLPQLPEALLAQGLQYPVLPCPACSALHLGAQQCPPEQAPGDAAAALAHSATWLWNVPMCPWSMQTVTLGTTLWAALWARTWHLLHCSDMPHLDRAVVLDKASAVSASSAGMTGEPPPSMKSRPTRECCCASGSTMASSDTSMTCVPRKPSSWI